MAATYLEQLQAQRPDLAAPVGEMLVCDSSQRCRTHRCLRRGLLLALPSPHHHARTQDLFKRKLYHELTTKLEDAVASPAFQQARPQ